MWGEQGARERAEEAPWQEAEDVNGLSRWKSAINKRKELKTHFHPETTVKEQGNYRQFICISTHNLISARALTAKLVREAQKEEAIL